METTHVLSRHVNVLNVPTHIRENAIGFCISILLNTVERETEKLHEHVYCQVSVPLEASLDAFHTCIACRYTDSALKFVYSQLSHPMFKRLVVRYGDQPKCFIDQDSVRGMYLSLKL